MGDFLMYNPWNIGLKCKCNIDEPQNLSEVGREKGTDYIPCWYPDKIHMHANKQMRDNRIAARPLI